MLPEQASSKTQGEPRSPVPQLCLQPREELRQGAGTAAASTESLLTPESAQPGRRVGGAIAGRSRQSSKAGGDHKWKCVVKHGGEHRLTLTFTVPPQKSTPR